MLFETKFRYEKTQENGLTKKVTETYLVRAETNAEAENTTITEMAPFCKGEACVTATKQVKYADFFGSDGDKYYAAKVNYVTLDEQSGVEKSTISTMLVNADDFDSAYKELKEGMRGTISDWSLVSLAETKIVDFFKPTKLAEPKEKGEGNDE